MLSRLVDSVIGAVSPAWALRRAQARGALDALATRDHRHRLNSTARPSRYAEPDWSLRESGRVRRRVVGRRDARELVSDNPVAASIAAAMVDNVVGDGIKVRSLAEPVEVADEIDTVIADRCKDLTIHGDDLFELQREWWDSLYVEGDAGLHLQSDGRVQLITADRIRTEDANLSGGLLARMLERFRLGAPAKLAPAATSVEGIDVDPFGRPVTFHVRTAADKAAAVPAAEMLWGVYRREHKGDTRGTPAFQTTYDLIHRLTEYVDAGIVAAQVAACFGVLITTATTPQRTAGDEPPIENLQPGMIQRLRPGEDVRTLAPSQPQQQMPQAVVTLLRLIGLPDRMPLEIVGLDFSVANFSAQRAALHQFRKALRRPLSRFLRLLERLYEWIIAFETKEGGRLAHLAGNPTIRRHVWTPPAWGYLDPVVEANADAMRVDLGFASLTDIHQEHGTDAWATIDEQAKIAAYARSKGVTLARSSNTRDAQPLLNVSGFGGPQ